MQNLIHFLNGKFVTEEELLISPRDLGFSRGFGVHDFIVTHNHKLFKLDEHINRLFNSAEAIEIRMPWSKDQISSWIKETLAKNDQNTEKMVKIFLTGGVSSSMRQAQIPTIIIMISEYTAQSSSYYENGVKVKASKYTRPYLEAKTNFYLEGVKQLSQIGNHELEEIVYYDDSQVFEGAGSNIFAVIDNKLITPKSNIVKGITRNTLLEILDLDIPIEENDITFEQLKNASEIFLTGSSKGVRGVIELNGKPVGDSKVGTITREVMAQYNKIISSY